MAKFRALIAACAITMCFGSVAMAQVTERVLVPIYLREPLAGAFGSSWITDVWVTNNTNVPVSIPGDYDFGCFFPVCDRAGVIEPRVTFRPRIYARPDGLQGTFLRVDARFADRLSFALRFRDLSRQSQSWGTELPVVREGEFHSESFSLVDVPITQGFRQVLRIYELGDTGAAAVRVRAYRISVAHDLPSAPPDQLLGESVLQLHFVVPGQSSAYPGYLAVSDLGTIAQLGGAERIRLEIEPVTPGLRLWAFVTVVNNETQHATVITPQ